MYRAQNTSRMSFWKAQYWPSTDPGLLQSHRAQRGSDAPLVHIGKPGRERKDCGSTALGYRAAGFTAYSKSRVKGLYLYCPEANQGSQILLFLGLERLESHRPLDRIRCRALKNSGFWKVVGLLGKAFGVQWLRGSAIWVCPTGGGYQHQNGYRI